MTWLLMNIPLAIVFVALWVGIPLWMVLKHPDTGPTLAAVPDLPGPSAAAPAVTRLPAREYQDAEYRRVA